MQLAVTLCSDAIFHDDYLRDCTAPQLSDFIPLGIDPDVWEAEPVRAFAATRMVFGFDGAPIHLPRSPRLAVSAGSVFMYTAKSGKNPAIPQEGGVGWIGDNNREGFGQAVLWHPFHCKYKS